ncbi:unnamed protein product, partial [marine sediment metagenome]
MSNAGMMGSKSGNGHRIAINEVSDFKYMQNRRNNT